MQFQNQFSYLHLNRETLFKKKKFSESSGIAISNKNLQLQKNSFWSFICNHMYIQLYMGIFIFKANVPNSYDQEKVFKLEFSKII